MKGKCANFFFLVFLAAERKNQRICKCFTLIFLQISGLQLPKGMKNHLFLLLLDWKFGQQPVRKPFFFLH